MVLLFTASPSLLLSLGAFHLGKKPKFRWEQKWNFQLSCSIQGRKPQYAVVPDRFPWRGPGTGTNYEKRVNGTRKSEIPTAKTGPPFQIFHFFWEFSSGTNGRNMFHLPPNQKFQKF